MNRRRKGLVVVASVLAAILLGAVVLYSVFSNPDRYRAEVISFLEAKTGKQIDVGRIEVNWMAGYVHLYDIGSKNPQPFPPGYSFKADRVDASISIIALLHRQVVIKSIAMIHPTITVISDPDGLWNFENPLSKGGIKPTALSLGTIPQVTLTGGHLLGSSLIDPSDTPGPIVFEVHNLFATLYNVNLDAFTGASTSASGTGFLDADSLRLGDIAVTKFKSKLRLLPKQVLFDGVGVHADRGRATGTLAFNLSGKTSHFESNIKFNDIDVSQLLAKFPGARGKMTGTMDGNVRLGGQIEHTNNPFAQMRGNGNLIVHNGELPTMNSSDSLKQIGRFRDSQHAGRPPSAFSTFSGDLDLANGLMSNHELQIDFYGVNLLCTGEVALNDAGPLNYQCVMKVLKKQGFFTDIFARTLHDAREENGRLVFPIRITGTLVDPKVKTVD